MVTNCLESKSICIQKVRGSNPLSSTKQPQEVKPSSTYRSIEQNFYTQLAITLLPFKTVKGLESEVIKQLLNSIAGRGLQDLRNRAMLLTFLDTGLRLSELANLTMPDIDLERGIIKTIGKGNKERFVRIGIKTQKALWNYLAHRPKNTDYVWLGKDNNKMATDSIAQMIRNLDKKNGMRLSPHKLRHGVTLSESCRYCFNRVKEVDLLIPKVSSIPDLSKVPWQYAFNSTFTCSDVNRL